MGTGPCTVTPRGFRRGTDGRSSPISALYSLARRRRLPPFRRKNAGNWRRSRERSGADGFPVAAPRAALLCHRRSGSCRVHRGGIPVAGPVFPLLSDGLRILEQRVHRVFSGADDAPPHGRRLGLPGPAAAGSRTAGLARDGRAGSPGALGIHHLYAWAQSQAMAGNAALRHKRIYLNVPFFAVRTVFYFAIWALLAHYLNKWSGEQDRADTPETRRRLYNLSGPGLVIYGLTMTFASMDWVMSLEPEWFSTIYSAMFMVGQVLSSLAFTIAVLLLFVRQAPLRGIAAPKYLNDLGNMLLTFVILWAYLAFSQFLIIWSGNLADEIPWYLHRSRQGWQWIAMALFVFHFAIPFLVLLSRDVKRQAEALSALAATLFLVRLLDMFWMVNPAFDTAGVRFHWLDWAATLGIGGIWVGVFFRRLGQRPLLPVHDPELQAAIERISEARVGEA